MIIDDPANGMRIVAILLAIPLVAIAAGTGRVERCNFDLRAPSRQIALHATEGLDTAVEASIRSDGTIPDLSGWSLLLWYGDAATNPPLGVAFTNVSLARGVARWDIPGAQIATNGRFAVQIVGRHTSGRSEEWARGWLAIDANSASSFSALAFGTPGWALATNVQAAITAEAAARAAGDLVTMTNWQARVNALTNGAALGATALQPSWAATGTVWAAERLGGTGSWTTVENGTNWLYTVTATNALSDDTSRLIVATVGGDMGDPVGDGRMAETGDVWIWDGASSRYISAESSWGMETGGPTVWGVRDANSRVSSQQTAPTNLFTSTEWTISFIYGTLTNSVPVTNRVQVTTEPTVTILTQDAVDTHDTNTTAHADIREAIDAIPLPPTNAVAGWLVWDTGSNCYWQVTATNLRFYVWGVAE